MISSGRTKFLSGFGNGRISDSCCRHKAFCIFKKQKTGCQLTKMYRSRLEAASWWGSFL